MPVHTHGRTTAAEAGGVSDGSNVVSKRAPQERQITPAVDRPAVYSALRDLIVVKNSIREGLGDLRRLIK